jgi:uncharacterized membrane protein YkvA (DUF1232 family)
MAAAGGTVGVAVAWDNIPRDVDDRDTMWRPAPRHARGVDASNKDHPRMTHAEAMGIDEERARERREALADFWETVKRLPAYARLVGTMARDDRVPWSARAMLVAGGAYLVSPLDAVPGIIPVAGQLDDMYVVLTALRQALRMTPDEVGAEYLERYGLDIGTIDGDLATIRTLVRVGVVHGARWGARQVDRAGRWIGARLARARSDR